MLFVGLLGFATTSTVVSCKDYDDDISTLNNRVDKLSAEAALHATKAELQTEVTNLKAQLDQAKADLQAAINTKADKAWVEQQIESLTGKIAGLETRIKANEDAIAAINTLVAELQTSKADKSWVEERLAELNNKKADKDELATEVGKLNKAIEDTEKALLEAIDKKADKSTVEQLQKDLEAAKADYTKKIAELNEALKKAQQELQAAIDTKADKATVEKLQADFDKAVADLNAAIALKADQKDLEAEIAARKAADGEILTYVDGKIVELDTKITALDTKLTNYIEQMKVEQAEQDIRILKLESDLMIQQQALEEFKEEVKEAFREYMEMVVNQFGVVEGQIEEINEELNNLNGRLSWAEEQIEDLFLDVEYLAATKLDADAFNQWVEEVYTVKVNELAASIEKVAADLVILENYVKNSLRSLVFVPDCYYWGIEAAKINLEAAYQFEVPAAKFDLKEAKGYDDDARYDSTVFKTTYGYAKYHKNPSNAIINPANLSLVSFDRAYTRALEKVSENAAPAGLSIVTEDVADENGDLYVPLSVADVSKVQKVTDDNATSGVTVFALQYKLNEAGKDTTITSDYAALLAEEHTVQYKVGLTNDPMAVSAISSCPFPPVPTTQAPSGHAMQTVHEASVQGASYELAFNDTIDLNDYVASHRIYVDENAEVVLTDGEFAALGYSYEFALTEYDVDGENQSAHASLDGSKLTTKKCDYDAILNGYTPVVRVVLKDNEGRILDYGYIMFVVTGDLCDYVGTVKYDVDDAAKVQSYWYAINGSEKGAAFDEIHYNVKTPEEAPFQMTPAGAAAWTTADMDIALALANNKFINVFTSENVFDATKVIVNDVDGDVNMVEKGYVVAGDFIFTLAKKNNGKEYKGDTGATYKMHITENGDSLIANKVGATVEGEDTLVATLKKDVAMAQQKLVLNHDSEYAKDLLNYKGRYDLSNDFLTVYVALGLTVQKNVKGGGDTWTEECKTVETDNVWPARFIRPINLDYTNPNPIQDAKRGTEAAEYKGQPAYLHDILSFTDWQNIPVEYVSDTTNCLYAYYGIESVEILDAEGNALVDGDDVIEIADNVLTNIANPTTDEAKVMKDVIVGGAVTLIYKEATATTPAHIWYINNGNTVSEKWWFEIPVRVNYYWGSFVRRVKVTVDPTYNKD